MFRKLTRFLATVSLTVIAFAAIGRANEELDAIKNRAKAAAPKLQSNDARVVTQGKDDLAKVRIDLESYAGKHGLSVTTETRAPAGQASKEPSGPQSVGECPWFLLQSGKICVLSGTTAAGPEGPGSCEYSCVSERDPVVPTVGDERPGTPGPQPAQVNPPPARK